MPASDALAALSTEYFIIPPVFQWQVENPDTVLQWRFMVVNGIVVSLLSEMRQQASAGFMGRQVAQKLGCDDYHLLDPASALQMIGKDRAVMLSGAMQSHEEPLTMPDGSVRDFSVTKGPILVQHG